MLKFENLRIAFEANIEVFSYILCLNKNKFLIWQVVPHFAFKINRFEPESNVNLRGLYYWIWQLRNQIKYSNSSLACTSCLVCTAAGLAVIKITQLHFPPQKMTSSDYNYRWNGGSERDDIRKCSIFARYVGHSDKTDQMPSVTRRESFIYSFGSFANTTIQSVPVSL